MVLKNLFLLQDTKKSLEKYYKNNKKVRCIFTGKNTLTGGRLLRLKRYFKKKMKTFMTYGDGLTNQNLKKNYLIFI